MLDHVYKRQFIETNGVILHTVEAGKESNPLVILLHGFPEFWYGWRHHISPIADAGYYVLVPDQRGYGRSEKPRGVKNYSLEEAAKDIIGLIDHTGHEKAIIIGHDWGGMVAWTLALLYPERLEKLGILNAPHPVVFSKTLRQNKRQLMRSWYSAFFQIPALPEFLMSLGGYELAARAMKSSAKKRTFTDEDIAIYKKAWQRHGAMQSMIHWYRAGLRNPPPIKNTRVSTPTLMIWGEKDIALDLSMAQASIDMCDRGTLITVPDATHWVQHDARETVTDLILRFLSNQPLTEEQEVDV